MGPRSQPGKITSARINVAATYRRALAKVLADRNLGLQIFAESGNLELSSPCLSLAVLTYRPHAPTNCPSRMLGLQLNAHVGVVSGCFCIIASVRRSDHHSKDLVIAAETKSFHVEYRMHTGNTASRRTNVRAHGCDIRHKTMYEVTTAYGRPAVGEVGNSASRFGGTCHIDSG